MKKLNAKKLYDKNGFLDIGYIIENSTQPFIFVCGGRGIGKSYGAYKYMLEHTLPFFCLRRTDNEAEIMANALTSQIASIAENMGTEIDFERIKKITVAKYMNDEKLCSFFGSLTTFKNFRGIDLTGAKWIIFDEFIPEIHTRKIKGEGLAFGNIYETINRNRELNGEPPVRCLFLANSFNIANDIFRFFGIVDKAEELQAGNNEIWNDESKLLIMPHNSPISDKKRNTAIYKATSQEFGDLALKNRFISNDFSRVRKKVNRKEYTGYCRVGELVILKHKTNGEMWCCTGKASCRHEYDDTIAARQQFRRERGEIWDKYVLNKMYFSSYNTQYLFERIMTD